MDRHQFDRVLRLFFVFARLERYLLQKLSESNIFAERTLKLVGDPFKFREVFKSLFIAQFADILLISGFDSDAVDDFGNARGGCKLPHRIDEIRKFACAARFERRFVQVVFQGREQTASALVIEQRHSAFFQALKVCHLLAAEFPPGRVDDALKRNVVIKFDKPQIGDDVKYLHPLVELDAAVDLVRDVAFNEFLFNNAGQESGPVQDGEI